MTRNSPDCAYQFPSVLSFFPCRDTLTSDLEVFSLRHNRLFPNCLALVDLEQLGQKLRDKEQRKNIATLLSPDEMDIFTSFSLPKRQIEWLGGRIAGKAAALLLCQDKLSTERMAAISILPRDDGSPQLVPALAFARQPVVSISHSKKFAAGMAAYASVCGVDIQKISRQMQRVSSRFAAPEEIILLAKKMPALNTIEHLSLLWSAKEALKKAILREQPVIFQGVLLKQIHVDGFISLSLQYPGQKTRLARVEAVVLDEYILAFTGES